MSATPVLTNTAFALVVDVNGTQVAAQSASAAQASAAAAAVSATTATTEAGVATTQATNAATSATASATSATQSAASATAAAASASSAATSATALTAGLASFNKTWLGPHASDPTLDNQGNALVVGAEYLNTTANPPTIRVYTSTGWQDQDATAEAASANASLSATQAATSASAASSSATAASGSATAAANSATSASGSASTATTQAGNAATSASNAASAAAASASSASSAAGAVASVNGELSISVVGGVTLTSAQAGNGMHIYTGALTANTTVTLPMSAHPFIVQNKTTGAFTLTVAATGGSATVAVPQGQTMELWCDGSTGILQATTAMNSPTLNTPTLNTPSVVGNMGVTGNVSITGKENAVNSANILINGSGELGNTGWQSALFGASPDAVSGSGNWFINSSVISANTADTSQGITIPAGQNLTISADIYAGGVTAGVMHARVDAYSASNTLLGTVCSATAVNGAGWARYSGTGVTPTNTAYVVVVKSLDTSPAASSGGGAFRRIKLEQGTAPSTYSNEGSTFANGPGSSIVVDTGVANAYVTAFSPALNAPIAGRPFWMLVGHTNNGASTLNATGTVYPLIGGAHAALQGNEMVAGGWALIDWNASLTSFVLLECTGASVQVGAGAASSHAAQMGQLTGRNVIINGACNIAQRASIVCSTGVFGYGGPDRYLASNANSAGGQFTQSQGSITFGGVTKNAVVQTVNTAVSSLATTNYWTGVTQAIEGFNCFNLLGQAATLSFIFKTNVTGTYSVALRDYSGTNAFVSSFAATANTPVKVSIPIPSIPASLTTPNSAAGGMYLNIGSLNNGSYLTSTLNSWQAANVFVANPSTNWGATAGNFIAATEIQLEAGPVATQFERRPYPQELALCARYCSLIGLAPGQAYTTTNMLGIVSTSVPMRAAPTLVTVGTNNVTNSGASNVATTSVSIGSVAGNQVEIFAVVASGLVAGNASVFIPGNGSYLSAEL